MLNTTKNNDKGWTIIELMVVVAVIAILSAIVIPNYLGMQNRAKKRAIIEVAVSAKNELQHWLEATTRGERGVLDVNGDGIVDPGEVHTNIQTVPGSWIQSFYAKIGHTALSPWYNSRGLFTISLPNNLQPGQINLCTFNGGRGINIIVLDKGGTTLASDTATIE